MTRLTPIVLAVLTLTLAAGTAQAADTAKVVAAPKPEAKADAALAEVIQESLVSKGSATMESMAEHNDVQKVCGQFANRNTVPAIVVKKLEDAQLETTHYPADNTWLGGWKKGEKAAQNDRGMQFSDPVGIVNDTSCYAYHCLSKDKLSYGTIDPSLYQYGKLYGDSGAILRYTWGKVYSSDAYVACSNMPRFGHKDILTGQQIRGVIALLLDPASPINQ